MRVLIRSRNAQLVGGQIARTHPGRERTKRRTEQHFFEELFAFPGGEAAVAFFLFSLPPFSKVR